MTHIDKKCKGLIKSQFSSYPTPSQKCIAKRKGKFEEIIFMQKCITTEWGCIFRFIQCLKVLIPPQHTVNKIEHFLKSIIDLYPLIIWIWSLWMLKVQIVCVDLGSCNFALSTSKANYQEFKANHTEVDTFWKLF